MGHEIPNTLGVDQSGIDAEMKKILPGFMSMGEFGMVDHQDHTESGHMSGPENKLTENHSANTFWILKAHVT
jgi:hypothetical protein